LRSDPAIGANSIFVLAPDKAAAAADVEKLSKLPEVSSVKTVESFIPDDQQPKLAAIHQLAAVLDPVLRPDPNRKPATDADDVAALKSVADGLNQAAGTQTGKGAAAAKRLAVDLSKLADGDEALRQRAHAAMIPPLVTALDGLRGYLQAQPVTLEMAEREVRDLIRPQEPKRIKIEDIQRVVARQYNVSRSDLLSSRRTANVVRPRQVAMYLAKTLTLRSLPEIGRRFGGRDHTTVLHAVRKIEAFVAKDVALSEEVESLKRQLQSE